MSEDLAATIKYNTELDRYSTRFEETPSITIIDVISTISGEDPVELDPLFESIDPEALDQLFSLPTPSQREGDLSVTFQYESYNITVHSYGVITAELSSDAEAEQN